MLKDIITSPHNERIKSLLNLQKSKDRHINRQFLIEGIKEIKRAVKNNYIIDSIYFCPQIIHYSKLEEIFANIRLPKIFEVSETVYKKIAYRENTEGIVAVSNIKSHEINNLHIGECPLILVMEAIEKPGNIGAMLRSADSVGVDAVILTSPRCDLYNANVVRASLGCLFSLNIAISDNESAINWLKNNKINIYTTNLLASDRYFDVNFRTPSAVVVGTEDVGVSKQWIENAHKNIIIPMFGESDSLNVSTAAAIIIFEARRQRLQ